MLSREMEDRPQVLVKMVDLIHMVCLVLGALAMGTGGIRSQAVGAWYPLIITGVVEIVVVVGFLLRFHLSPLVRSVLLLGGMALMAFAVLWEFGLMGTAGLLLPVSMILAWLIWTRQAAFWFSLFGGALFIVAASKHMLLGELVQPSILRINKMPVFWCGFFIQYMGLAGLVLGVTKLMTQTMERATDRAETAERESRLVNERLVRILEGVNDAIFLIDPQDGKILEVYGRYQEIYGFSKETILQGGPELLSAGSSPWTAQKVKTWAKASMEEGPQQFTWRAKRGDGTFFWADISMRRIELDQVPRILVTARDIDHMMQIQVDLAHLNVDLEHRVQQRTAEIRRERDALDAFSYTVSHDLRTPLRAIDGYARILEEDFGKDLPDEAKNYLDRIALGAHRMARLIDALLSLSRINSRRVVTVPVDVSAILAEVHLELKDSRNCRVCIAGECNVKWEIDTLPVIQSDPEFVRQVFANVIGNACKFTRGKINPRISVKTILRGEDLWFEVADNGSGFDMAFADKLFKMFHRLHDDSIEGMGIGLATVKKIVDLLGGEIEAEAKLGEGATFRFRLTPAVPVSSFEVLDSDG